MSRARPRIPVGTLTNAYSTTSVSTTPVQLSASLGQDVNFISVSDTSNLTSPLVLMYGPVGAEVELFQFTPGMNRDFNAILNKGMRVSVKATSGTASTGNLVIGLFQ